MDPWAAVRADRGVRLDQVERGNIALLGPGAAVSVACDEAASFIMVGGKPLNEPIARYGPFVMNTADEIRQAIMDFQAGRF